MKPCHGNCNIPKADKIIHSWTISDRNNYEQSVQ